jgi:hypothetical protein
VVSRKIDATCEDNKAKLTRKTTAGRQELWPLNKWIDHVRVRRILRCKKKGCGNTDLR